MIYVNDEKANLKDSKTAVAKEFNAAMEYFNEVGWPINFKVRKSNLAKNETEDGQVYMVMAHWHINHSALVHTGTGTEFWRYTPTPPYLKDGTLVYPTEGKYQAYSKKRISFTRDKADLAFFLWYKSKPFRNLYEIDDAKSVAEEKVKAEMDAIRLKSIFYGENSVLQKDKEKLATVARAYNVSNVKTLTDNQRLIALEGLVTEQIKKKKLTVDEFAESLQLDILTELSASIQKAVEDKLLTFDDTQNVWFYINADGAIGDRITQVPISRKEDSYNYLRDHFKSDQKSLDKFEAHVKNLANRNITIDFDNLENLDWINEVVPYCNLMGIKGTGAGRPKEVIFEEIREKCQPK